MRILLVSDTYLPTISGVTTVVSEHKKALEKKGHTVGVLIPKIAKKNKPRKHFFEVAGISNALRSDTILPIISKKISKKISGFNPEVIHIHSPGLLGLWARYFAKKNKVKLVTSVHGIPDFSITYLPFGDMYQEAIQKSGWKFFKWFLEPSDVVTTGSLFVIGELKKQKLTQKIVHLPFWIEPYSFKKKPKPSKNTVFLFFGRLDNDKNLSFLIKSWSKTKTKNKKLIIAGRNLKNQKEAFVQQAENLGCRESIKIYGKVNEKRKKELFSQADFFVMPSKVETQSIVACQAALSGIPIVVADSGALPEIVKASTQPHLIFNPNLQKSLTTLLDDCHTNKEKYKKSYRLNKNFTKFLQKEYLLSLLVSEIYAISQ